MMKKIYIGFIILIIVLILWLTWGWFSLEQNQVASTDLDAVLINDLSMTNVINEKEYREYNNELKKNYTKSYFKVHNNGWIEFIYVHVKDVNLSINNHLNEFEKIDDIIDVLGNQHIIVDDGYSIRISYYDKKEKIKFSMEYFDNDRELNWISLSRY